MQNITIIVFGTFSFVHIGKKFLITRCRLLFCTVKNFLQHENLKQREKLLESCHKNFTRCRRASELNCMRDCYRRLVVYLTDFSSLSSVCSTSLANFSSRINFYAKRVFTRLWFNDRWNTALNCLLRTLFKSTSAIIYSRIHWHLRYGKAGINIL